MEGLFSWRFTLFIIPFQDPKPMYSNEVEITFTCVFIDQNRLREEVFFETTRLQLPRFINWNFTCILFKSDKYFTEQKELTIRMERGTAVRDLLNAARRELTADDVEFGTQNTAGRQNTQPDLTALAPSSTHLRCPSVSVSTLYFLYNNCSQR